MMFLDLNISIIMVIFVFTILYASIRSLKNINYNSDSLEKFAVIDAVRFLKKTCPVQFSNKWKLVYSASIRCWYKNVFFPGVKSYLKLYGASCAVTCSSLYAFSMISDVSTWGEWESSQSAQNLFLRLFYSDDLSKDHFMQADQVAGIQRGTNIQSYTAMCRFLSPPSKYTKWILFWNVKTFEFMFFLIQPVTNPDADSQCIITHLYASMPSSSQTPISVSQRIRNIQEFLHMSQLNTKPLKHSATKPTPLSSDARSAKDDSPDIEDPPSIFSEKDDCDTSDSVFMLVPIFYSFKFFSFKRLKGYNLVLKKAVVKSHSKKIKTKIVSDQKLNVHKMLRRTVSDLALTENTKDFNRSLQIYFKNTEQNIAAPSEAALNNLNKSSDSIIVKESVETSEVEANTKDQETSRAQHSPPKMKLRSLSEPIVANIEKSKSMVDITSDEDNIKSLQSISELEESTNEMDVEQEKNEIFCSSTSDFEMVESTSQHFLDTALAGYLTQGNYGASVLQTEMMFAAQFDRNFNSGNRVAGGWIHTSTYKGIPVLTKSISGKIMKISSFLCQIEIPVNCKDVWKCVKNPRFRFIWDESVKTVKILTRISDSQKLIHTYHETTGVLRKEAVDFCLLQTEREEKDNFYSVFQSIEYEKCPFMQSVTRGSLKPSGWIVQSLSPMNCKITYLIQIFVNSPDSIYIHELNSLVPQSLHNLRVYLTSKPK